MPPKPLRFFIIFIVIISIFFRFTNLDTKVYWYDEVSTSLTVAGYTEAEIIQSLNKTELFAPQAIQKYQRVNPEKTIADTVIRLIEENPHHPPFYYVLNRIWSNIFGTSIPAMRSLAACISLLAFPFIYWLCLELFKSSIVGWTAIALIAVSPLHLIYAQEARQYSLLIVLVLFSSAIFMRAVRVKTLFSWAIYATAITLGLYTQLFFGLVAIGHGLYLLLTKGLRFSKTVQSYLVTLLISFVMFIPWVIVLINQYSQAHRLTNWVRLYEITNKELVQKWVHNLSLTFFDIGQAEYSKSFLFLYVLLIGLVIYSIFFLCRNTNKHSWLFILILMGITTFPFVLADLFSEGQRSITSRYFIPCYLGIQLTIAYFISNRLNTNYVKSWQQKYWHLAIVILISLGVISSTIYSQADNWWNKFINKENIPVSQIVNQAKKPLLVSNTPTNIVLSLSYMLEPKVRLQVVPLCGNCTLNLQANEQLDIPQMSNDFSDIFLLKIYPSESWKNALEAQQKYKVELVFQGNDLWLWSLEER